MNLLKALVMTLVLKSRVDQLCYVLAMSNIQFVLFCLLQIDFTKMCFIYA